MIDTRICTASGLHIDPLAPHQDDIVIEDIGHALANVGRFTGHTRKFYSVAQHSWVVSMLCPREHALAGLLHDASEAYMADIAAPIKQHPIFDGYRYAEAKLQGTILRKFGLPIDLPQGVKDADYLALLFEAQHLMPAGIDLPKPPR